MAKGNNKLSGLGNLRTSSKVDGIDLSRSLKPTTLSGASSGTGGSVIKPPSFSGTRTLTIGAKTVSSGIQFGRPSNSRTSTTQSGSLWTGLLKQSASGGLASAFTGGLSSLGGLGGLFSGILSLFGGGSKKAPPALVEFKLPNSISQTVYVSSQGASGYQGNTSNRSGTSSTSVSSATGGQQLQYQTTAIAQAVKTALLNSSSLNDVIAEI